MNNENATRFVSPKAWERIEQWSRRKPVFALMGEFSAGKSTLINFLLRTQTLPTQVTATQLPPVWFSWGNRPAYVKHHDGTTKEISLDELESIGVNDAQFVRIFLEVDILEAVDLIDTPGISDPKISTDVWQRAVGQANGVLWCTHATQAWRETERATWVSLPERLQNNSLLLITRADALGQKDRQKVLRRVNREAGHLFNRSILFSARDAIQARDKTGDPDLWARSGGGKMIDSFLEITEQIMENRSDQLARYQIDKGQPEVEKVQPLRPERKVDTTESEPVGGEAVPLKLVNPLGDQEESRTDDSTVVTTFPVRPARVERRSDDSERPRIDADEAERWRAEMVPAGEVSDTEDDDLRAFFRDTSSDPLELTTLAQSATDIDEFDLIDETDDEDNIFEPATADVEFEASDQLAENDDSDSDLLETLDAKLAETPEVTVADTDAEEKPEGRGIEVSVSSITALMAEQAGNKADDYEPEPESNSLIDVASSSPAVDEDDETTTEDLNGLLNVPVGAPLSASAMWKEISSGETLPEDAEGLKNVFKAFLAEFDQIALEHSGRQAKEGLRPLPKATENTGAEWHVL